MDTFQNNDQEKCFDDFQKTICSILHEIDAPTSEKFIDKVQQFRGNFYITYPYLFSSHYPNIAPEYLTNLALAGNLYFSYLLVLDEILDGQADRSSILVLHLLHKKAQRLLDQFFSHQSKFWIYFDSYENEFIQALKCEQKMASSYDIYNNPNIHEELVRIAKGKSAFAKCATGALLVLSGSQGEVDPFIETQDLFHIGIQHLDDLRDWKEDFKNNRPSFLLSLVYEDSEMKKILCTNASDASELLGRYIYYSEVALKLLNNAEIYFQAALQSTEKFEIGQWKNLINGYIQKSIQLSKDLNKTRQWILEKRETIKRIHNEGTMKSIVFDELSIDKRLKSSIESAISYLCIEQENGFPEMNHRMTLPNFENSQNPQEGIDIEGNLFQRTIVLDAFIELSAFKNNVLPKDIINNELMYIVDARMKSVRGGWNYFPGYLYLPPDTDDLAQVIQVLTMARYPKVHQLIDDPITLLISSNRNENGTFCTWILDPNDQSNAQKILYDSVRTHWGDHLGRDIEVTANILYSLFLYDPHKYQDIIAEGMSAVIASQMPNGMWPSVWYCGQYYGTYMAVRLLKKRRTSSKALQATLKYLIENQHQTGGWGEEDEDPLSTAFAILTLHEIDTDVDHKVFDCGLEYLLRIQKSTGAWNQVPFITMSIGKKNIIYKSETITTAFVLKALIKIIQKRHTIDTIS